MPQKYLVSKDTYLFVVDIRTISWHFLQFIDSFCLIQGINMLRTFIEITIKDYSCKVCW